jgi:very-short-patch-repair endonuclease
MERMRDAARRLGIAYHVVADLPAELADVAHTEWSNGWQERIVAAARALPAVLDEFEEALESLSGASTLPVQGKGAARGKRLLALTELCLTAFRQDLRFAFSPEFPDMVEAARKAIDLIEAYRAEEAALSASYAPEVAKRLDLQSLQAEWAQAGTKFWFLATLAKRKVARQLTQAGGATAKVDPDADLPHLATMRVLLEQLDALTLKASAIPGWQALTTQRSDLEAAINRAEALKQAIAAEAETADDLIKLRSAVSTLVVDANDLLAPDGAIARGAARLRKAHSEMDVAVTDFDRLCHAKARAEFPVLRARASAIVAQELRLHDWANWQRVRDEAVQLDLLPLVDGLEQRHYASSETIGVFETAYARWFAFHRMDAEPLLRNFMPGEHADCIERFRKIDDRMSELASQYIRAKICGNIPGKDEVAKNSGFGALRYQLQLQRPSKPIRQLATEMGDAFTCLAPCMLMSPLSIAQYLPPDQSLFDIVIFDEASQITTWDAIGAMARGKQVIIAGDPCQMPPSSNFEKQANSSIDEDDDTEEDMESILDECLAAGVPQINLDWHYRSRHESLITFSNVRYYDNRLVTFPAPDTRPSAVSWRRVEGVFAKGKERTNAIEAQAIVDEAVRYLRDPAFVDEKGRPLSLGIITMNVQQMSLVERLLDVARQKYPAIEKHFSEDRLEPVCVRNLETAQGDERDVILLGVNFGPTEPGGKTMSMSFGKLNMSGGWRRLNVAVTRARREMKIFSSFEPGMIDLTRTNADGVRDLKAFLEFAQRGKDALASADRGSLGGYDSPFEEAVAQELRRRGWQVVPQVGVSKFRIDLGIVHPDLPGDFLLGVECDGAAYHSAATARDRDKVRAAILEGLGWKLLRVWSTEWWFNRSRAAEQLHSAIEQALELDRQLRQETATAIPLPDQDEISENLVISDDVADEVDDRHPLYAKQYVVSDSRQLGLQAAATISSVYRLTNFEDLQALIKPNEFYEAVYLPVLAKLVERVVGQEGPIAESQLVNRIARAHGFQRSGSKIHDRVMRVARKQHHVVSDGGAEPFIWLSEKAMYNGVPARFPESEEAIRQIEDIAKAELRSAGSDEPVEIARLFGVRRLSATAKARIESALQGFVGNV